MSQSLVNAVKNNDLQLAQKLISQGVDVNQTDNRGNSLLIISAADGYTEMVKLLLEAGADITAVDGSMKATALHAAAYLGHPEVMQILVDYGIELDAQGPYNGYTALHDAVLQDNIEGVEVLVKAGANKNLKGHDGNTPFNLAQSSNQQEIVKILS